MKFRASGCYWSRGQFRDKGWQDLVFRISQLPLAAVCESAIGRASVTPHDTVWSIGQRTIEMQKYLWLLVFTMSRNTG
jgi:hypothetical protein